MQTFSDLKDDQLVSVQGGGDSFARDLGQFVGGASGWISSNSGLYFLLGGGIGGLVAIYHGAQAAER